jgi:ElaB/YqjD/DUF883 family membrane-anchored ribosome-binding protein
MYGRSGTNQSASSLFGSTGKMRSPTTAAQVGDSMSTMADTAKETLKNVAETIKDKTGNMKSSATAASAQVGDSMSTMADTAKETLKSAAESVKDTLHKVGVAAGVSSPTMSDGVDNLKQSAYNKTEELKHSTEESKNRAKSSNTDSSVIFWCARAVGVLMLSVQRRLEREEWGKGAGRTSGEENETRGKAHWRQSPKENKPNECAIGGETRTREQQQR